MDRRRFLAHLGLVTAASSVPITAAATPSSSRTWPTIEAPEIYHGYRLHWTGWKSHADSPLLFGQWLGWPDRGYGQSDVPDRQPYLYLAVPGFIGGPYRPGAVFDISLRGRVVSAETSPRQQDDWIFEGRIYLRQLVDAYAHTTQATAPYNYYRFPLEGSVVTPQEA